MLLQPCKACWDTWKEAIVLGSQRLAKNFEKKKRGKDRQEIRINSLLTQSKYVKLVTHCMDNIMYAFRNDLMLKV